MTNIETLTNKTVKELRTMAQELEITSYSNFKKEELVKAITDKKLENKVLSVLETPANEKEITEIKKETEPKEVTETSEINLLPTETEIIPETVKPVRKPKEKIIEPVQIFDNEGKLVITVDNKYEAIQYCLKEKIMNPGWCLECLAHDRKAYFTIDGKKTSPKKNNFIGIGFTVTYLNNK